MVQPTVPQDQPARRSTAANIPILNKAWAWCPQKSCICKVQGPLEGLFLSQKREKRLLGWLSPVIALWHRPCNCTHSDHAHIQALTRTCTPSTPMKAYSRSLITATNHTNNTSMLLFQCSRFPGFMSVCPPCNVVRSVRDCWRNITCNCKADARGQ